MAAIGQLLMSISIDESESIIKAIFLLSNCETEGLLPNGEHTECFKSKIWLTNLVTVDTDPADDQRDISNNNLQEELEEHNHLNEWGRWALSLYDEVSQFFNQDGSEINAYHLENVNISKRLLNDLKLFPIWGNILSPQFNFGRIPASSAPAEGEINKLKTHVMKQYKYPVRVDRFVDDHLSYLQGKMLLINAQINEKNNTRSRKEENICKVCDRLLTTDLNVCFYCNGKVHKNCMKIFGENKTCMLCASEEYVRKNFTMNEIENWRGKGKPQTKRVEKTIHYGESSADEQCEYVIGQTHSVCPVCANGDLPGGAHKCVICTVPVHAIDGCSIAQNGADEGYGQKRICIKCVKFNPLTSAQSQNIEAPVNITEHQKKSTGMKGEKVYRRPAKYLGKRKSDIKDSLQWGKNRPMPIIKNGNSINLMPVTIDGKAVSLRNTCAFDAIFYILLVAILDFEAIKDKVNTMDKPFFKMVMHLYNDGLNSHTYVLRAKLLAEIFKVEKSPTCPLTNFINCYTQVGWLAQQLFRDWPSMTETSRCIYCDYQNIKYLTGIQIEDKDIKHMDDRTFIPNYCTANNSNCLKCFSENSVQSRITALGDFIIFQIFNEKEENEYIKLKDLKQKIYNPLSQKEELLLIGAIAYYGAGGLPPQLRSLKNEDSSGHYVCFSYRRGNTSWMEIDDLRSQSKFCNENKKIVARLVVYIKI